MSDILTKEEIDIYWKYMDDSNNGKKDIFTPFNKRN